MIQVPVFFTPAYPCRTNLKLHNNIPVSLKMNKKVITDPIPQRLLDLTKNCGSKEF